MLLTLSQNASWSYLEYLGTSTSDNNCKLLDDFNDSFVLTIYCHLCFCYAFGFDMLSSEKQWVQGGRQRPIHWLRMVNTYQDKEICV